jgi:ADP-heptose:LPS heptosyltransferase
MSAQRILVLQMKRIGDLILTAPALADLRWAYPEAEIELVVAGGCRDLAECLPGVTRVLVYTPGRLNAPVWAAAATGGGWQACVDFTGTDRAALLTWLSGAATRIGYEKFSGRRWRAKAYTRLCAASVRDLHTVDFHRALVAELTGSAARGAGGEALVFKPETEARVEALVREAGVRVPFAILHPGTARREKFWPAERWVEVARSLRSLGCQVVLTGTGTGLEAEDVAHVRAQAEVVDLTGRLTLAELAALMRRACLAIGVDSMAMHLAALWQVPQVVLFGPTNPFHWRPRHDRAVVLGANQEGPVTLFEPQMSGGGMERIQVSAVVDAVEGLWERSEVKAEAGDG